MEDQTDSNNRLGPLKSYYDWITSGLFAPLKILVTGIVITELALMKFILAIFTVLFTFLARELYLLAMRPEYDGHEVWDKLEETEV